MEALNILWKIVPKSEGTIGILRVTVEGVAPQSTNYRGKG